MSEHHLLLALIAFVGYCIESIIGFGGTVVFIGLAGLYFDFKDLLYLSMLVSCVSSVTIVAQSARHVAPVQAFRIFMVALPGLVIGTQLISIAQSGLLLKCFGILLVAYSIHGLLYPAYAPSKMFKYLFVAVGGFVQGLFTTGGPFVLMGYRREFSNKTEAKATMAVFFLVCNIYRIGQTLALGHARPADFTQWWWMAFPVVAGVIAGHIIHGRLPEKLFQRCVLMGLMGIGILITLK